MTSYYHYDGQLSTRQLTDALANVTDGYTYDAFGILLNMFGATDNEYLYTGEQFDPNIGFYYLRARYYNPYVGRFITVDPWNGSIYDPVSLHKYLYCGNDPINFIDPHGNFSIGSLSELSVTQSILSVFQHIKSVEFQLQMRILAAGANIMGLTLKTFLPDEILQLKVNISGITLTVDQWLTATNIITAIGGLSLSFTLVQYSIQFQCLTARVLALIPTISAGVTLLRDLPKLFEDLLNKSLEEQGS